MGSGGIGVRLGFVVLGEDTDQCCKVYQLHVIVTVVTAIVLFFCLFFSFKTTVGWGGDAQNFILIYDFYIYIVCIFVFAKNVELFCT